MSRERTVFMARLCITRGEGRIARSRLLKIALRLLKIALSPDSQPHFERSEEICLFTEEAGEFQQPVS
jgi:hypothetical protein